MIYKLIFVIKGKVLIKFVDMRICHSCRKGDEVDYYVGSDGYHAECRTCKNCGEMKVDGKGYVNIDGYHSDCRQCNKCGKGTTDLDGFVGSDCYHFACRPMDKDGNPMMPVRGPIVSMFGQYM